MTARTPLLSQGRGSGDNEKCSIQKSCLCQGDLLFSKCSQRRAGAAVIDTANESTDDNLHIDEFHTYFAGNSAEGMEWVHNVYDATDSQQNRTIAEEVAANLRQARRVQSSTGLTDHEIHMLAILGGLPGTNGAALRQATANAAQTGQLAAFASYRDAALHGPTGPIGQRIVGSTWTAEEAYAHVAALGFDPSLEPIPFHCPEGGCPHRARLLIDQLIQIGAIPPGDIPEIAWALTLPGAGIGQGLRPRYVEDQTPLPGRLLGNQVEWPFHVAPTVNVEGGQALVIDPSLSRTRLGGPLELSAWHTAAGTASNAQLRPLPMPWDFAPAGYFWSAPGTISTATARRTLANRMLADPSLTPPSPPRPLPSF